MASLGQYNRPAVDIRAGAETSISDTTVTPRGHLPIVHASLAEPCPGRTRDLVITSPCPWCTGRHRHLGVGIRRAGCGRGRYRVLVARRYRLTTRLEASQ